MNISHRKLRAKCYIVCAMVLREKRDSIRVVVSDSAKKFFRPLL
jgi:hypothetical protein